MRVPNYIAIPEIKKPSGRTIGRTIAALGSLVCLNAGLKAYTSKMQVDILTPSTLIEAKSDLGVESYFRDEVQRDISEKCMEGPHNKRMNVDCVQEFVPEYQMREEAYAQALSRYQTEYATFNSRPEVKKHQDPQTGRFVQALAGGMAYFAAMAGLSLTKNN